MAKYGNRRRRYRKSRSFHKSYHRFIAGSELKKAHHELAGYGVTDAWTAANPGTTNALCAPGQGVNGDDRVGDRYSIESLNIKGSICMAEQESQTNPPGDHHCRLILGIAHKTEGAEVNPAEVLEIGSWNDPILAMRNLTFVNDFTILSDQMVVLKMQGMNEGAANLFTHGFTCTKFSYFKKFKKPISVKCITTGNTIASVQTNSLFLLAITDAITDFPSLSYQVRTRFRG